MTSHFEQNLAWARAQMPRLQRALARLPELSGVRLACSIHLDIKMIPLFEGLLNRGARLFITTCNPATVRDEVVEYLSACGAETDAWCDMPPEAYMAAIERALDWGPTHLCEMGADLTTALLRRGIAAPKVRAGLEATGSGIARLTDLKLYYPIFNWDDLPIKEGLHNRLMVGLTTWHTFFSRTRLTLHGKRVVVVGYGSVGRGVADVARTYGGLVRIVDLDPARALEATYAGWEVRSLAEAIAEADVIVTATGARGVINSTHLPLLRDGVFLLNVGHRADEIDVEALQAHPHEPVMPFIEAVHLDDRTVYLLAGGSMLNLAAGEGDSLNAFDVTLAVMASGVGHIIGADAEKLPGVYILPREVWEWCAA